MKYARSSAVLVQAITALAFCACSSGSSDAPPDSGHAMKRDAGDKRDAAVVTHDSGAKQDGAAAASDSGAARDASEEQDDASATCRDGGAGCPGSSGFCPQDLAPTYESIRTRVFAVSCGADGSICHSAEGGGDSGGLHLAGDPYTELLGTDGQGALASNIAGSVRKLRRVVPGDPDHSFLIIKLSTKTTADPDYGAGMPFTAPGSMCPAALDTIRAWITAGAAR